MATDNKVTPLETANKEKVNAALKSLVDVLNAVEHHYFKGGTAFEAIAGRDGAVALLSVLGDGIKRKKEREELIKSGKYLDVDLPEQI